MKTKDPFREITLSIVNFNKAVECGNFAGIKKFIEEFEPLYVQLFSEYRYTVDGFKNEVREIYEYLFGDKYIYKVAEEIFIKEGIMQNGAHNGTHSLEQKIEETKNHLAPVVECERSVWLEYFANQATWDHANNPLHWKNPLYNVSDEEFMFQLAVRGCGSAPRNYSKDPVKTFAAKYKDRYRIEEKRLQVYQIALIHYYEGNAITRENAQRFANNNGYREEKSGEGLYQEYTQYCKKAVRRGCPDPFSETKLKNKIERIESILNYLSVRARAEAEDDIKSLEMFEGL